jgi:hypothetical protein
MRDGRLIPQEALLFSSRRGFHRPAPRWVSSSAGENPSSGQTTEDMGDPCIPLSIDLVAGVLLLEGVPSS